MLVVAKVVGICVALQVTDRLDPRVRQGPVLFEVARTALTD
jgi:hypothetical protein